MDFKKEMKMKKCKMLFRKFLMREYSAFSENETQHSSSESYSKLHIYRGECNCNFIFGSRPKHYSTKNLGNCESKRNKFKNSGSFPLYF